MFAVARRCGIALLPVFLAGPGVAGGNEPASETALVRARVTAELGRPAELELGPRHVSGPWTLVCGDPVEPSGAPLDLAGTRLSGNEFGAHFCALLRETADGPEIVEFEIGSNDMPAVAWIEEHRLPESILGD